MWTAKLPSGIAGYEAQILVLFLPPSLVLCGWAGTCYVPPPPIHFYKCVRNLLITLGKRVKKKSTKWPYAQVLLLPRKRSSGHGHCVYSVYSGGQPDSGLQNRMALNIDNHPWKLNQISSSLDMMCSWKSHPSPVCSLVFALLRSRLRNIHY